MYDWRADKCTASEWNDAKKFVYWPHLWGGILEHALPIHLHLDTSCVFIGSHMHFRQAHQLAFQFENIFLLSLSLHTSLSLSIALIWLHYIRWALQFPRSE